MGRALVAELRARGDEVTALSRDPDSARRKLGPDLEVLAWREPKGERPPAESLAGHDAVVHLLQARGSPST